ncbi:unnamed protein product [Rotaria sordida]|uniref:Mutator-like transposase domain-containing protein n=1 Tax=Rotaria sordida TaxID=392033 RepID=A0A819QJM8_9BILA|nr:unnamed protein product [Rotaria sordida]CAF1017519.1 unnamed protein product [Rotaria sordida]CAF4032203.1 unnamed protein product [Rotaria sordida]CAF4154225.1 unnamed protein product [Rotaria sordida]
MPTTKGRNTHQRSKAAICRKARSRKREQFRRSASARSSSLSSSELSSKLEETFISSLYSTTDSSFSNNILHQSFTSQQKLLSYEKRKNHAIADCDDMNFYQVIHNTFLLELLKNTICIQCREPWDGKMYIRGHLAGIGRAGIVKAFGAMNVAPPVHEEYYEEIDKTLLLPCIKELQNQSMQAAIYEAVDENDGDPTALTVSGDGTWQKRGFKSIHGIAAILSASRTPKVLDVERLSKKCLVCTGALSIKKQNPDLYHEIIHNHDCESNYDGSSVSVGLAVMIYNDGYLSIGEVLYQVLDELGHFSFIAFDRMNKQRLKKEARWRKRREQQTGDNENMSNDNDSDEDHDDDAVEDYQAGAY